MSDTTETPSASRTTMSRFLRAGGPGRGKMRPKTSNQLQSTQQIADFNEFLQQSHGARPGANVQLNVARSGNIDQTELQVYEELPQTDQRSNGPWVGQHGRPFAASGDADAALSNRDLNEVQTMAQQEALDEANAANAVVNLAIDREDVAITSEARIDPSFPVFQ